MPGCGNGDIQDTYAGIEGKESTAPNQPLDPAGISAFRGSTAHLPPRQVSKCIRKAKAKEGAMEDRLRLRPTPEQYQEFGNYLCKAHSWYKHLPLLGGPRFVVFVAADAGVGRLVAVLQGAKPESAATYSLVTPPEGPEFTDDHPRLHHGWQTTKEYRRRFGYLDFMSRQGPDEPYARDAGPPVRLPDQVEERCGFVLYPYVSRTFAEALIWGAHEKAIGRLRAGAAHSAREEVLELARLAEARETAWSILGDPEREWALYRGTSAEKPIPGEPSVDLRRYLDLDDRVQAISGSLKAREVEKISRALAELDDWLLHGR
jgi:hypothetical protein